MTKYNNSKAQEPNQSTGKQIVREYKPRITLDIDIDDLKLYSQKFKYNENYMDHSVARFPKGKNLRDLIFTNDLSLPPFGNRFLKQAVTLACEYHKAISDIKAAESSIEEILIFYSRQLKRLEKFITVSTRQLANFERYFDSSAGLNVLSGNTGLINHIEKLKENIVQHAQECKAFAISNVDFLKERQEKLNYDSQGFILRGMILESFIYRKNELFLSLQKRLAKEYPNWVEPVTKRLISDFNNLHQHFVSALNRLENMQHSALNLGIAKSILDDGTDDIKFYKDYYRLITTQELDNAGLNYRDKWLSEMGNTSTFYQLRCLFQKQKSK